MCGGGSYVIQPERQTLAEQGIECRAYFYETAGAEDDHISAAALFNDDSPPWRPGPYDEIPWRCKSASVLSAMACSMLVGSFLGGPVRRSCQIRGLPLEQESGPG